MWHVKAYLPAAVKTLSTDTFALLPAMSAGAPVWVAKNSLCAIEPNVNVTVWPAAMVSVAGVNAIAFVAATVLLGGGGGGGGGGAEGGGAVEP